MSDIASRFQGASQHDIHRAVCSITDEILKLRGKAHSYGERVKMQRLRQQRAALQALLTKPTLVWSAP